ncbi:nuclear transport factor 2 family protein [Rhodococcus sp. D2-41]|uniref:Nuclear transport factor 2 family protein n=1 Tax=Speluncibacter jeojiensis TaxID=2710754 RepID=A0A9X4M119_9ACTN|nr:nuclear transport factor 2 family protein [Rhodococcus sp. D2-41]MDG3012224.1 nuclear transport factor 2 family protein [Rhodococcus sp. D2-41]MDG3014807.1 nuclear transport factor 2 family protein [Corynebacteriales bacterium D3-21]
MDLVAIAEISRLKYRYMRDVDTRQWDDLAETLTPDVTADYGKDLHFDSRDELIAHLSKVMSPRLISEHHLGNPEIDVADDGVHATGSWYLSDTVIVPKYDIMINGASIYSDEYVKGEDGWRISRTGYTRLYEYSVKISDMPSFKLMSGPYWA